MRTVTNLIPSPTDFTSWGNFLSGDGAVSVVNGALTATATNGRAFKNKTFPLVAGRDYKLTINVPNTSGDVAYPAIFTSLVTPDTIPVALAIAGKYALNGRFSYAFTATGTGNATMWVGIGTSGNQATPGSITVEGIQLEDITGNARKNASEFVSGTQQFNYNLSNYGVTIGDSICLTGYYADQLMQCIPSCDITKKGVGGQRLPDIQSRFALDVVALAPRFVIIEGGINDIQLAATDPTPAMQTAISAMVEAALSAGIYPIVLNVGPFKGAGNWTAQRQTWLDAHNAWLPNYAQVRGIAFADIYSALQVHQALPPEYDSGDHLHPSTLAHRIIGNLLAPLVGFGATVPSP